MVGKIDDFEIRFDLNIRVDKIWSTLVQGAHYESTNIFLSFEIYNVNSLVALSTSQHTDL